MDLAKDAVGRYVSFRTLSVVYRNEGNHLTGMLYNRQPANLTPFSAVLLYGTSGA